MQLPPIADSSERPAGPLEGLVVADFSRVLAGPYITMLMADLGAEVIKVEGMEGDDTRRWLPPQRDGVSTYYMSINRNKRSIALDFGDPEDLELAYELIRRSDIMVENFKPGGLKKFGLDYDAVRRINPAIIYGSITGFGPQNPGMPGFDLIVQAMSGMMSVTGNADGEPTRAGVALFDVITGLHCLTGILSSLHRRTETGEGQLVEVNLLASALSGLVNQTGAYVMGGAVPQRAGNAHASLFPYEPMKCADGELVIAVANDGQFTKLTQVLGVPELAEDPRFAKQIDRNTNRGELGPLLEERLATRGKQDWYESLLSVGVPCGPIEDIAGGIAQAERLNLEPVVQVGRGESAVPMVRNPITFSEMGSRYDSPPPAVDEHGDSVRAWLRNR